MLLAHTGNVSFVFCTRNTALCRRSIAVVGLDRRAVAGLIPLRTVGVRRLLWCFWLGLHSSWYELRTGLTAVRAEI